MIILRQKTFAKEVFTKSTNDLKELGKLVNENNNENQTNDPKRKRSRGRRRRNNNNQNSNKSQQTQPKVEEVNKTVKEGAEKGSESKVKEKGENFIKRTWKSGKLGKAAIIGAPIVLAGGGLYAYQGIRKNNKVYDSSKDRAFSNAEAAISRAVKRNKTNLNNEELSDYLEGPIERLRRRRGRRQRRVNAAKKQLLNGYTAPNAKIDRAEQLAMRSKFDNEEAQLVENRFKKLKQ